MGGRVADVMTKDVVVAHLDTPYKELVKQEQPGRPLARLLGARRRRFDVDVKDGVVVLQGCCERRSLIPVVVRAVAAVDGVVRVENRLGYDIDDLASPQPGTLAHSR